MPEKEVVNHIDKVELASHSAEKGTTSGLSADHPDEHGTLVFHEDCLAKPNGKRQSISFHKAANNDPVFQPLPRLRKKAGKVSSVQKKKKKVEVCTSCNVPAATTTSAGPPVTINNHSHLNFKSAAKILNALTIRGHLFHTSRGKELVIGIDHFIFRICLAQEAHLLWIPTSQYDAIVEGPLRLRGEKGHCFTIPAWIFQGPPGKEGIVSIQFAFRRPDWTLILVDHNVQVTLHVMSLRRCVVEDDFKPESQLWPYLWSKTHGPVHYIPQEAAAAAQALDDWRLQVIEKQTDVAIFVAVTSTQTVFNGYGAQETTDMLAKALLPPWMPASFLCGVDLLWARFRSTVISYQQRPLGRTKSGKPFRWPSVSGSGAFAMRDDAHTRFLRTVTCYRRQDFIVDRDTLQELCDMNLLNPFAVFAEDGNARVQDDVMPIFEAGKMPSLPSPIIRPDVQCTKIPNYRIRIRHGGETATRYVTSYTPFLAFGEDWGPIRSWSLVKRDVADVVNSSTLGPYSFQVLVSATWSASNLTNLPIGDRRLPQTFDKSTRKRKAVKELREAEQRRANRIRDDCNMLFTGQYPPKIDKNGNNSDSDHSAKEEVEAEEIEINS